MDRPLTPAEEKRPLNRPIRNTTGIGQWTKAADRGLI